MRAFVEAAAPLLGLGFEGDLGAVFALKGIAPGALETAHAVLWPALEAYPPEARNRFSFTRPNGAHSAVYLHPGEPFFDRFLNYFLARFAQQANHGAVFVDPTATKPYLFHLAESSVLRLADAHLPALAQEDALETRLMALREDADGAVTPVPVETLLLRGREGILAAALALASAAQVKVGEVVLSPLATAPRAALLADLPEREQFLRRGYGYQEAELAAARARFQEKVAAGDAYARGELTRIKARQRSLADLKEQALETLRREPELVCPGEVVFLAHALVIPSDDLEDARHRDQATEAIAMQSALAHEQAAGAVVHDVHTSELARQAGLDDYPGFDLLSRRPDGSERAIEVKGRAQVGDVDISRNEWAAACNLGGRYWLYVVYHCASPQPRPIPIQDPWSKLMARAKSYQLSQQEIEQFGGEI